jgi:hypothetical protein
MVKIEIVESLYSEISKKFKQESVKVFEYIKSLEKSPMQGKALGTVGGVVIKELKYRSFRFYFITDGFKLRCIDKKELEDLLMRFVRMSNKKQQQKVINEIKHILKTIGPSGFK